MEKTCRACESQYPLWQCADGRCGLASLVPVRTPHRRACSYHKPHETPLLVDVLVEALKAMLTLPYWPLRSSPQQASRIDAIEVNAKAAVSRYQEEVGDA